VSAGFQERAGVDGTVRYRVRVRRAGALVTGTFATLEQAEAFRADTIARLEGRPLEPLPVVAGDGPLDIAAEIADLRGFYEQLKARINTPGELKTLFEILTRLEQHQELDELQELTAGAAGVA
jgi:hypothetical protein